MTRIYGGESRDAWSGAFIVVLVDAKTVEGVRRVHILRDAHASAAIASLAVQGSLPTRFPFRVQLNRPCQFLALVEATDGLLRTKTKVDTVGASSGG